MVLGLAEVPLSLAHELLGPVVVPGPAPLIRELCQRRMAVSMQRRTGLVVAHLTPEFIRRRGRQINRRILPQDQR